MDLAVALAVGGSMAVTWWLAETGRWRLALAIPCLVILLPGIYGSCHYGARTVMVLFYALSILLAGALLGHGAQWWMFALVSVIYVALGWSRTGFSSTEFLSPLIATAFGWLGIALFQRPLRAN